MLIQLINIWKWATVITPIRLLPLLLSFTLVSFYSDRANNGSIFNIERSVALFRANISNGIDPKTMKSYVPGNVVGDWMPMPLSKMIGTSELIVYGKVKNVLDSTILFQVTRRITGDEKEDVIEIVKARPDPFAAVKPAPYQAGQCYLLFLESGKAAPKKIWKVTGIAQEGQMPVMDTYIYFNDRYFDGIPIARYKVNGVEQNIQRFGFSLFLNAADDYKKCYRWIRQGQDNKYLPEKICKDNEVTLYGKKSFMHNFLVNETKLFIANK
jgi:hypothetical protein